MAKYEDLVHKVAIHVSPCPENAIIDALQRTVRRFCMDTKIWVYDHKEIQLTANTSEIELVLPENTTATYVWGLNGRNGSYSQSDDYYLTFDNRIVFNKQYQTEKAVKPLLSLMPSANSDSFSDLVNEYCQDTIIAGAVAYLQEQPFREWSQPNAVAIHESIFQKGIQDAIQMRDNGLNMSRSYHRVRPSFY